MKRYLLLCLLVMPLSWARAEGIDLSGDWSFRIDSLDVGVKKEWYRMDFDETVKLPGSMTTNGKGNDITVDTKWTSWVADSSWYRKPLYEKWRQPGNTKVIFWMQPEKEYVGPAWYSREFEVPASMSGQEMLLTLERVHWESLVWIDGKSCGMRNSLSTPHYYDLGELLPGKHRITVRVDNSYKINVGINAHSLADHTQTNWNGIVGEISLTPRNKLRIDQIAIYPDNDQKVAKAVVRIENSSKHTVIARLDLTAESKFTPWQHFPGMVERTVTVAPGVDTVNVTYPMGKEFFEWDEHTPYLYAITARIHSEEGIDVHSTTFGMRKVSRVGRRFTINGRETFLRGTLDCATYPRTGYPPTDIAEWRRVFTVIKNHGLNHVRYHSWCPPEAAFEAADQLGVYLQVEGASWSDGVGQDSIFNRFLYDETERIMDEYGNHPSFLLYTYGNEPSGEGMQEFLNDFVGYWKQRDPRHKYTSGAGWPDNQNNDYHNDGYPRIYWWFAGLESYINKHAPSTDYDWYEIINQRQVPHVAHEIGNWCVYPNFREIDKYDGCAVRARNFEVFREMLADNGLAHWGEMFLQASGKLQAICWKAELEAELRTPDFAGFQMLSLSDFPGQGSALVGVLDAFWEQKGYISPAEFSRFAGKTVPLARMKRLIFPNSADFEASVEIAHFDREPLKSVVPSWTLSRSNGEVVAFGNLPQRDIPIGNCIRLGDVRYPLEGFTEPEQLKFTVRVGIHTNEWDIWVYPDVAYPASREVLVTDTLDSRALNRLINGGKVLFTPRKGRIRPEAGGEVTLGMSTIFWNTGWTLHLQPPYALGILTDPEHPALRLFPTEFHQNFQWWDAMLHGNAIKMDCVDSRLEPIVRVVDDWFQNWSLGLIFEAKVGQGDLLVCGVDLLSDSVNRLEARQLQHSLVTYMESEEFRPQITVDIDKIQSIVR